MEPQILGKYKQEGEENLKKFFLSLGFLPYLSESMANTVHKLEIYKTNEYWTLVMITGPHKVTNAFKLGEPYSGTVDEMLEKFQNTATLEGDILTIESVKDFNFKIVRFFKPTETGCILTLLHPDSNARARRIFVRR